MGITLQTLLLYMLDRAGEEVYGAQVTRDTGLSSSHLYPALARLLKAGAVSDRWEQLDAAAEGRPPRRYYKLTPQGAALAERERARLQSLNTRPVAAPNGGTPA